MTDVRLIDANELKEKRTCLWDPALGHCACVLIEDVDSAPTICRPQGRWERCFEDWRMQIEGDKCSICGFEHYGSYYHYCPNCGAKMDGKENDI